MKKKTKLILGITLSLTIIAGAVLPPVIITQLNKQNTTSNLANIKLLNSDVEFLSGSDEFMFTPIEQINNTQANVSSIGDNIYKFDMLIDKITIQANSMDNLTYVNENDISLSLSFNLLINSMEYNPTLLLQLNHSPIDLTNAEYITFNNLSLSFNFSLTDDKISNYKDIKINFNLS